MNSQTETDHVQKNKNNVKSTLSPADKFEKKSDQKSHDQETEDPEHEYIAGEKEGDFPPDVKMNENIERPTQEPVTNQKDLL